MFIIFWGKRWYVFILYKNQPQKWTKEKEKSPEILFPATTPGTILVNVLRHLCLIVNTYVHGFKWTGADSTCCCVKYVFLSTICCGHLSMSINRALQNYFNYFIVFHCMYVSYFLELGLYWWFRMLSRFYSHKTTLCAYLFTPFWNSFLRIKSYKWDLQ